MSCPKCGSSDKHFCPPSLGEHGFYLCECPAPASPALAEAAREILAYRETAKEANRVHIELHNQNVALQAEVARLRQERMDYSSVTTTEGLNASEWVWRTGKAEREAKAARAERDAALAEVQRLKVQADCPYAHMDGMVCTKCGWASALLGEGGNA